MKIELSKIKPSPNPIRKTWDEEKMQELSRSIKEQGMVVPIKVRPDNGGYEIVYGHRRLEAARRAGFSEVEAIVEGVDDIPAHRQSLTENKVREEMAAYDVSEALQWEIDQTGETHEQVGKRYGMHKDTVTQYLNLLKIPFNEEMTRVITHKHLEYASAGAGEDKTIIPDVLHKAAKEDLSLRQTKKVAESIAATQDPRRREALLNTPYSSFIHDPEINRERAEKYGAYDPLSNKHDVSKSDQWQNSPEVVALYDYLLTVEKYASDVIKMDKLGKFAPEARPFTIRKIQRMIGEWEKVIEQLGSEK